MLNQPKKSNFIYRRKIGAVLALCTFFPVLANASDAADGSLDLTSHWVGFASLVVFVIAYVAVIIEEKLDLHKSKPVLFSAGVIWIMIALAYQQQNLGEEVHSAVSHYFLEYSELFFFLLVAMTYINAMLDRGIFEALRHWLVSKGFSYRQLFWLTGIMAFFISPIADNLTTALIMCAVVLTVGAERPKFISIACVGIVIAANAGGAFSPFGDITTLMVWQKGIIEFYGFFNLFIPALVNYLVPAAIMQFFIEEGVPPANESGDCAVQHGGYVIVGLFLLTIITAIVFHNYLHLPSALGMLMGLSYLKFFGFYLRMRYKQKQIDIDTTPGSESKRSAFDVFSHIAGSEWDTLFFFYGVILSVSGLGFIGYLSMTSELMYGELGPTVANILVGIMSAIIDNIPVMFAILNMHPAMDHSQWLLVTLTAGVGGSLLSIGSAAGVALMGQAKGSYSFMSHLKWTPVISLGYFASIYVHLLLSS